jgi:hypothetical protein
MGLFLEKPQLFDHPMSTRSFVENDRQPSFQGAPDGWDCAFFGVLSKLWQFSVSKAVSPQPPVTPAVRRFRKTGL